MSRLFLIARRHNARAAAILNNMKAIKFKVLYAAVFSLLLLSPLLMLVSCESAQAQQTNSFYDLSVSVDGAENKVSVDMTVTVINTFKDGLDTLVFAFYPDAFTLKNPPPVDASMMHAAYPHGINAGGYVFMQSGGENVKSASICETPCKIQITLRNPLSLGESTKVTFSYNLTLPLCNARYGYNDFSINLSFFYPQLCRYDKSTQDFVFYDYLSTGDPFVFDVADYSLKLDCPADWQIACSARETDNSNNVRSYSASSLRDLALFIAPEAESTTVSANGYTVNVIHDGSFSYAAQYAADALSIFSESFCELPHKNYSLVFTPFMTGGAEFSNAALISSSLSFTDVEKIVVHEVAHQWWYNLVGSDQVSSPWQDEALAQWSALLYFQKRGMSTYAESLLSGLQSEYVNYVRTQRELGENALCNVMRSTTDYRDFTDYYITVYCKATVAVNVAAGSVTAEKFCKALSLYAKRNSGSFAMPDDLFDSLNEYSEGLGSMLKSSFMISPYG